MFLPPSFTAAGAEVFSKPLLQSPGAGAVWETCVFAHWRHRERGAGRVGRLFFWRDRTRELDFVAEAGGRIELFEAKWTERSSEPDAVNLRFVRDVMGESRVFGGGIISARSGYRCEAKFLSVPLYERQQLRAPAGRRILRDGKFHIGIGVEVEAGGFAAHQL